MGIRARQVGHTFTHISKQDVRPKEGENGHDNYKPTKWKLKVLDSRLLALLKDKTTKIGIDPSKPDEEITTTVAQNAYNFDVCQFGLDEPEDFYLDEEGREPVRWTITKRNFGGQSYSVVDNAVLGLIDDSVIAELAERILAGNSVSVDEGNGSGSQS